MRLVFGLVLVIGLALAGFAVYMAQGFINQTTAELAQERAARARLVPTVDVLVVKKNFVHGDILTKDDVQTISWPENALPKGVFSDLATLFPEDGRLPRIVLRPIEKFEPVLAVKVTEPGEDAGITSRIERGTRAFAIKVDVASGVSGFLRPGDSVDIYWTGSINNANGDMTRLIEPTVKIIAVDQSANDDRTGTAMIARTITVQATPGQVARLAQAQATGRLALSLVGASDDSIATVVDVDSNMLLGIKDQEIVQVEEERVCTIKTRKGSEVLQIPIPCTN